MHRCKRKLDLRELIADYSPESESRIPPLWLYPTGSSWRVRTKPGGEAPRIVNEAVTKNGMATVPWCADGLWSRWGPLPRIGGGRGRWDS